MCFCLAVFGHILSRQRWEGKVTEAGGWKSSAGTRAMYLVGYCIGCVQRSQNVDLAAQNLNGFCYLPAVLTPVLCLYVLITWFLLMVGQFLQKCRWGGRQSLMPDPARGGGQAAQPWSIISSDWFSILHWLFPASSSLHWLPHPQLGGRGEELVDISRPACLTF